jgi:hypothetical protein
MKRTTIMLDECLQVEAKYQAALEGKTMTALIHAALEEYIAAHRTPRPLPEFVGMGNSGDPHWAERDEEILAAEIDPVEGWSPGRFRSVPEAPTRSTGASA